MLHPPPGKSLILGVDPGLQRTGWGVLAKDGQRLRHVANGAIVTQPSQPLSVRLMQLYSGIAALVARYHPTEAAIEETFLNKNANSSLKLGHARGALMVALESNNVTVSEYSATKVKKTVTGAGKAEKEQVQALVRCLLPGVELHGADAADALAVAICHAHHGVLVHAKERVV